MLIRASSTPVSTNRALFSTGPGPLVARLLFLAAPVFAGCVGGVPDGPTAPAADDTLDARDAVLLLGDEATRCANPVEGFGRFSPDRATFDVVLEDPASFATLSEFGSGGRVLLDDLDGDGDLDAAFGAHSEPPAVFRNEAGSFERVVLRADLPAELELLVGLNAIDLDGDGLPDLVLAARNGVAVMRNVGGMVFEAPRTLWSRERMPLGEVSTVSAGDLDGDGDLDLMVASSGFALDVDPTMPGAAGLPVELLMIEDGKVIAVESVVPFLHGASLRAAVVSDTDHDGQAELLLFSDGHDLPNALMVRGESGWTDVAPERFFDLRFHGVGAASADLNDDGRLDWCVSDLGPPQCFLSFGEDEWTLAGEAQGLVDDTLPPMPGAPGMLGRGLSFSDLDNDGYVDLSQASGPAQALVGESGVVPEYEDRLWAGGPEGFEDRTADAGFDGLGNHLGVVSGDVDGDGWPELLVAGPGERPVLFRNRCGDSAWLDVDLVGPPGNPRAVGAQVRVQVGDVSTMAEVSTGRGPNQGPARLHFGMGDSELVDRLEVQWPDGSTSDFLQVPGRRLAQIQHPAAGDCLPN